MSNNQNFPNFSFSGLQEYEPYEGGSHGMVPREGLYHVKVMESEPTASKDPNKPMAKIQMTTQDADAPGIPLIDRVIYAGMDSKGKPLSRQFADFMYSAGTPKETIRQHAAAGTQVPIQQILAQYKGRDAYVEVVYKTYKGEPTCEIKNWVTKERYQKAKENGGHRGRAQEQVNWAMLQQQEQQSNQQGGGGFSAGAQPGVTAPSFGGGVAAPAPINLGGPQGFAPPSGVPNNAAAPTIPNL